MIKRTILIVIIASIILLISITYSMGQIPVKFLFSIDIGSDTELSDPTLEGNEGFDPGDIYRCDGPAGSVVTAGWGGTDGREGDDEYLFLVDPKPDAGSIPVDSVPIGTCLPPGPPICYQEYFDLDAYDVINLDITQLLREGFSPPFLKRQIRMAHGENWLQCIHDPKYIAVSFDDDATLGWADTLFPQTPENSRSPRNQTYGKTLKKDEVVGIELDISTPSPPYSPQKVFGYANEGAIHADLLPNPDSGNDSDDDVDALDVLYPEHPCDIFLFSADHEGRNNPSGTALLPGAIYQRGVFIPVIKPTDLGLSVTVDIDAFEMVWLPTQSGDTALGILFSVDDDDPRTRGRDESGPLNPSSIYASLLNGTHYEFMCDTIYHGLYAQYDGLLWIDKHTGAATHIGDIDPKIYASGSGYGSGLAGNSQNQLYSIINNHLISINKTNPLSSVSLGLLDIEGGLAGMSFENDSILYYCSYNDGIHRLYKLNIKTLSITEIGITVDKIEGLGFDMKGNLWGGTYGYCVESEADLVLCEIDITTGDCKSIREISLSNPPGCPGNEAQGLTFDGKGKLYIANHCLWELEDYYTTPSPRVIGKIFASTSPYAAIHNLASTIDYFDDIDAIMVSDVDFFVQELDQPIIFEKPGGQDTE